MLQFFTQLNSDEQQSLLNMVKTFIKNRPKQYDDDVDPVTVEEYNTDLEEADAEIKAGNYVSHEEVKRRFIQ